MRQDRPPPDPHMRYHRDMATRAAKSRKQEPEEKDASSADDLSLDLRPELALVRQVMRRLVILWDRQGDAIESEEARRLAALIFNGARTAAILLFQETRRPEKKDEMESWLSDALDALSEELNVEL